MVAINPFILEVSEQRSTNLIISPSSSQLCCGMLKTYWGRCFYLVFGNNSNLMTSMKTSIKRFFLKRLRTQNGITPLLVCLLPPSPLPCHFLPSPHVLHFNFITTSSNLSLDFEYFLLKSHININFLGNYIQEK